MPNETPQTLPANFFDKKGGTPPVETLPPDFFSKKESEEAAAKSTAAQGTISAQPSVFQKFKAGVKSVAMDPFNLPSTIGSMTSGIENYTQMGRAEHPVLSRVGDVTKSGKDYADLLATTLGITGGAGFGGPGALGPITKEVEASKVAKETTKLQKINKLLGVTRSEVVPGKTPETLAEFAANPARGVAKAGLDEAALSKMSPLERNAAIAKAKDAAGKQIDTILDAATQSGKTVDLYPIVESTFDGIQDAKLAKQSESVLVELLKKNGVTGTLDKVTPTQARAIQRGLEEAYEGQGGMGEIAEKLQRGIREATRKAVPESASADQHYWDLANAFKGTQRLAKDFAKTIPENKLRDLFVKSLVRGAGITGGGGLVYELLKSTGVVGKGSSIVP